MPRVSHHFVVDCRSAITALIAPGFLLGHLACERDPFLFLELNVARQR